MIFLHLSAFFVLFKTFKGQTQAWLPEIQRADLMLSMLTLDIFAIDKFLFLVA
jgi:hypothetical protein